MTKRSACFSVLLLALVALGPRSLEAQDRPPLRIDQVVELITSGIFPDERVILLASQNCIAFQVNQETSDRLAEAGASSGLIGGLSGICVSLLVRLAPTEVELQVDSTTILQAEALSPDSVIVPSVIFEWISSDTSIAEVNSGGLVLAKSPGLADVRAMVEDSLYATTSVRVIAAGPAVDLVPSTRRKSVGTAAILGIFPGGGEFYVGNTTKGIVVLGGAAAALTAGFLLSSEDTLSVMRELIATEPCIQTCSYEVVTTAEVEEKNYVVVGAAVAGAFWLYGLIDGILAAKKSQTVADSVQEPGGQGMSLQLAPPDGVRFGRNGEVELTFLRIRS